MLVAGADVPTVLVVAGHEVDCSALVQALESLAGYEVVGPLAALDALRVSARLIPAVLLVHVELQDITPVELCSLIRGRANGTQIAILLFGPTADEPLTAGARLAGAVNGFVSQADLTTLTARVAALTRQATHGDHRGLDHYRGRHLEAQFNRVEIIVDGVRVDLTRRELALLRFLVTHTNRVLCREDMLGHVWHNQNDGRSRTVDVHIRRLRLKLGEAGKQIQTVPGVGYRFSEE